MALRISQTSLLADAALQGYWKCDGNFNDSSSNGYNLTPANSPTFVTGKFGQAGHFITASSQSAGRAYASITNLIISGAQTWMCWFKPSTITSYQVLMSLSNADGTNRRGLLIDADGQNSVNFDLPGLTPDAQASTPETAGLLTTGSWYHVAGVYDGSTLKIYLNGVEKDSTSASGTISSITGGGFNLGKAEGGFSFYYDGDIDDGAIFSRALTAQEILNLVTGSPNFFTMF